MSLRRQVLTGIGGLSLAATAILISPAPASAAPTGNVTVLHGIADIPVDVYINDALAIADFTYGEEFPLGAVEEGEYNVKMCTAMPDPPATLPEGEGCPVEELEPDVDAAAASVGPNTGIDFTLEAGVSYTLAAVYSPGGENPVPAGRPTIDGIVEDTSCVPVGRARMQIANLGAFLDPARIDVSGVAPIADLEAGGTAVLVPDPEPLTDVDILVTDSADQPVTEELDASFPAGINTLKIIVGNPQQEAAYDILSRAIPLTACPITTTTAPPVVVRPNFTG